MKKHAKLPSMHINNCWVDLGELYMILTVHGSDHKKSNASNIINEYSYEDEIITSQSIFMGYLRKMSLIIKQSQHLYTNEPHF